MDVLLTIALFILGVAIGMGVFNFLDKYSKKLDLEKREEESKLIYMQILRQISLGNSVFKNRTMNTVYISVEIEKKGKVDLLYMMDKNDIAVAKGMGIIYTSINLKPQLKNDIITLVNKKYKSDIENILNVFGIIFSKKILEKHTGFKIKNFEDLVKKMALNAMDNENQIKNIYSENNQKLDIDEILDKISSTGMSSLTKKELDFLENKRNDY